MSEDKTCNGWSNYETWCVNLWLENDGILEMWRRDREKVTAESIKDFVNESNPLADACSMFSDMMSAALSEVDYYEIAEAFNSDNENEETEEE